MKRFCPIDRDTKMIVNSIIEKDFKYLLGANIAILFDSKKSKKSGRYIPGKFKKTNDIERYLSTEYLNEYENPSHGYDYLMLIDENIFEKIDQKDKIRLIRHLLEFADIDYEADNPYKIRDPEVSTWFKELEFNKDDPTWYQRIEGVAESIYDSEIQETKEPNDIVKDMSNNL